MITPLLFPYTCISDAQREKILTTFGSLAMFGTRKGPAHSDPRIKTIVPVSGDENRLSSFLKEYSQYTNNSMDRVASYLKGHGGTPMVEPDGVPAIRSEILKGIADGTAVDSVISADPMEHLFRARVLLEIANDYDEKQQEIDQEMESIALREKMMLEQLQGGDGSDRLFDINLSSAPDQSSDMSIEHRLSAWADLFIHAWPDTSLSGDGLFLTTSQAVMDILTERIPELVKVDGIDNKAPSKVLRELAICDYAEESLEIGKLLTVDYSKMTVYIAPDVSPELFFLRLTGAGSANKHEMGEIKNTVICFFA